MADDPKPKEEPKDDAVKNLKAEMDRKLGNLEKTNQALIQQLQIIAAQPKTKEEPKKQVFKDLWFDDPDTAATVVVKKAKDEIREEFQRANADQAKKGTVIQGLYREYPELQDFDNPLTVKAVEIFEKMSDEEKVSPIAYKLAVKEAAEELDIKPKAKRKAKEDDDNFSLGGSGKGGEPKARKKEGLDPKTVQFAKLVGLNTDDEKVMASLKSRAERKNWMTWE